MATVSATTLCGYVQLLNKLCDCTASIAQYYLFFVLIAGSVDVNVFLECLHTVGVVGVGVGVCE